MPKITSELGKEWGIRSGQVRRQKAIERAEKAQKALTDPVPVHVPNEENSKALNRVRKQIQLVNTQLEQSISDPDCTNKYSAALDRLYKIEQGLSMRPGPGQLRPASKQVRTRQDISPIEPV